MAETGKMNSQTSTSYSTSIHCRGLSNIVCTLKTTFGFGGTGNTEIWCRSTNKVSIHNWDIIFIYLCQATENTSCIRKPFTAKPEVEIWRNRKKNSQPSTSCWTPIQCAGLSDTVSTLETTFGFGGTESIWRRSPSPPLDNIQVMLIVWRLRGNIIRTALCWIVSHNVHNPQHTYVSSSYSSNRLGFSQWDPYAMLRGGCLELYYCNMVVWFWWDSSLIFDDQMVSFSALVWSPGL